MTRNLQGFQVGRATAWDANQSAFLISQALSSLPHHHPGVSRIIVKAGQRHHNDATRTDLIDGGKTIIIDVSQANICSIAGFR
ncbi:MAG: hypothetical protein PUF51_00910 [Bifidobacteriaceae bacterium]|nr:hypothetical protein [Bifidobacteriaceae bacterium]